MSEQWFNVGNNPTLTINCQGSISIRGRTDGSVVAKGNSYEVNGTHIESQGDLRLWVPLKSNLAIVAIAGDCRIKGVGGSVSGGEVAGDVVASSVEGDFQLEKVYGDLKVRHNGGAVVIKQEVAGDVSVNHAYGVNITKVYGDVSAKSISGALRVGEVYGDVAVKSVTDDVTLENVHGDCALANLSGTSTLVNARDDIRISGSLSPGKHSFSADSTITFRWPADASLAVTAKAPKINNRLTLDESTSEEGALSGTIGGGDAVVNLSARDRITLRPDARSESEDWTFAEFEFDMAGIGEKISAELNTRMEELSSRIGPEINVKVEGALRKAQAAVERVAQQMEREISQAQAKASRKAKVKKKSRPSRSAPQPEPAVDTSAEQLKILSMLEEGTISIKEANELLASLG